MPKMTIMGDFIFQNKFIFGLKLGIQFSLIIKIVTVLYSVLKQSFPLKLNVRVT